MVMILSRPTEYAIRVVVYLSFYATGGKRLGFKQIASNLDFPEPYLAKILQGLAKKHIIESVKGPKGGFYLKEKTLDMSLLSLIDAMEGLAFFDICGLGLQECNENKPCPIHRDYQIIKSKYYKILKEKTIGDMRSDIEKGRAFMNIGHL